MKAAVILEALAAMVEAERELKALPQNPVTSYEAYAKLSEARIKLYVQSGVSQMEIVVEREPK